MKTSRMLVAVTAFVILTAGMSRADTQGKTNETQKSDKPLQLAIIPPSLQIVPEDESISGIRLEIYGRNQNVRGVDIGLMHEAMGDFRGVQFGVLNLVHGDHVGLQLAGIYSETKKHISGFQVGMVNHAASMSGIQIGFVNFADDMTGFQFGIFNEISSKATLPVLPLINAKF